MRYLLIDRITEWDSKDLIKGTKNVAMSEDFLEFHFPKNPVMPGILILEAMAQLAGWLEAKASDFENWVLVHKIEKCSFYGFVFPGDQIEIEVRSASKLGPKARSYVGTGKVAGKKKISAEFGGEIVDLSSLENIGDQRRFF